MEVRGQEMRMRLTGVQLLGVVAAMAIPMPLILYFDGRRIRRKSKFAPAPDIDQDRKRDEEEKPGVEHVEDSS
jgi:DHA1 family multidrug resistance protein-like MFS transporter